MPKAATGKSKAPPEELGAPFEPTEEERKQVRDTELAEKIKSNKMPTTKTTMGGKKLAAGGSVRGCGIAQRGRTKGRIV